AAGSARAVDGAGGRRPAASGRPRRPRLQSRPRRAPDDTGRERPRGRGARARGHGAGMKAAFLLAHGTPDSLDEMPEYLTRVRGGRPPTPELVLEMRRNYAAIGGRSPLTDITRAQAEDRKSTRL